MATCAAARVQEVSRGQLTAALVVGVDVPEPTPTAQRATAEDGRHAERLQPQRQLVLAVQGQQQHPVDVTTGGVGEESLLILRARHHGEHQLEPGDGDRLLGAAQHPQEERVGEHPLLGLLDEEGHRVAAPGDQRARRQVGHVGDLLSRREHHLPGALADLRVAAQHAARRGARDAGARRHLLQRRGGAGAGPLALSRRHGGSVARPTSIARGRRAPVRSAATRVPTSLLA